MEICKMDKITNNTAAALAMIITLGLIVLIALGQPVPGELWSAFGVVIGFFFGRGSNTAKAS
jgi:hypothetical protein